MLLLGTSIELQGYQIPFSHSAFILVDQWTGSRLLRQTVELSSGKGWVERAPWVVCLFYKLLGSIVLSYLFLSKQITGMKATMFSFSIIT